MSIEAREIHQKEEEARERGDFLEALELSDRAMVAYAINHDLRGLNEVLAARSIIFRHLAAKHDEPQFLYLALLESETAVINVERNGDPQTLAIPYFNLGKSYEYLQDNVNAAKYFERAIQAMKQNPPKEHNRPAVLADMEIHLATALYLVGDKTSLDRFEKALHDLEAADEDNYNKKVWLSGAYMSLALMLKDDDHQRSQESLNKAREIIEGDERLTLRKGQLDKLVTDLA